MRRAVSKIIPSSKFLSNQSDGPLANFASTLKMDFNAVDEFYILLDDPHKSWLPGDEVSGQIILISKKNLANIVITLSLIGFVKINASSHSKLRPIKHTLFNHTIKIYGDANTPNADDLSNGLYKGEHRFPFIVKLPNKRIFTSIDFGKGSINYVLRSSIGGASSYTNAPSNGSSPNDNVISASSPAESYSPNSSNVIFAKTKRLHNPYQTYEKIITLISPIDVTTLPSPKPKRLIIKDPRSSGGRRLSRTQSSTSTINTMNTFSTMSSNNSEGEPPTAHHTPNSNASLFNSAATSSASGTVATPLLGSNITTLPSAPSPISQISPLNQQQTSSLTPNSNHINSDSIGSKKETIKVSLEIPRRGYLRGELISIKLSINHLKKIQDSNGIIITFVRVCRLDNGPDSLFESFRKDLQQLVMPLYVDPVTLCSEIKSSVRVPADAFPTISGCPLVSFQYFIEVLINLSGKSVVLDSEVTSEHHNHTNHHSGNTVDDCESSNVLALGNGHNGSFNFNFSQVNSSLLHQKERSGFINTDRYKRLKKFLQLTTEVIIGTHRLKNPATSATSQPMLNMDGVSPASRRSSSLVSLSNGSPAPANINQQYQEPSTQQQTPIEQVPARSYIPSSAPTTGFPALDSQYISVIPESMEMNSFHTPPYFENHNQPSPTPANFPAVPNYDDLSTAESAQRFHLLHLSHQGTHSEKERMRQHESSLLPSAPPDEDDITVLPVNPDIMENIQEQDELHDHLASSNSLASSSQPPLASPASSFAVQNSNYNFFITQEHPNPVENPQTGQTLARGGSDNTIPLSQNLDEDPYSAIDFVPNYDASGNDRLVAEGSKSRTSSILTASTSEANTGSN